LQSDSLLCFKNADILQGNVVTYLKRGEIFSDIVIRPTHFLLILTVKEMAIGLYLMN